MNWDSQLEQIRQRNSSAAMDISPLKPFAKAPMLSPELRAMEAQEFEPQAIPFAGFVVRILKESMRFTETFDATDNRQNASTAASLTEAGTNSDDPHPVQGIAPVVYIDVLQAGYTYTNTRAFPLKNWYYETSVPFRRTKVTKMHHVPGTIVNLVVAFSEFYQHDVFDLLPRVRLVLEALFMNSGESSPNTPFMNNATSFPTAPTYLVIGKPSAILLEGLGIPPSSILVAEPLSDVIYTADEVLLPNFAPANGVKYNPLRMGIHPEGYLSAIQRYVSGRSTGQTPFNGRVL